MDAASQRRFRKMGKNEKSETARSDVYARITERNIVDRENDVRPWMQHR